MKKGSGPVLGRPQGRCAGPDGRGALRCLGAQIREQMAERDQPWVLDQIMDVEMPELLGTLKKAVDGVLARYGR